MVMSVCLGCVWVYLCRLSDYSQIPVPDEDDDVAQERKRIYSKTRNNDILHVRDLTKVTINKTITLLTRSATSHHLHMCVCVYRCMWGRRDRRWIGSVWAFYLER